MSAQVDVLDWINRIPCRCMSIAELGERDTGCKRCQARAAVAALIAERDALREALEKIGRPQDCGCKPCTGRFRMSAQDLKQRARELLAAEYRIRKPYRTGPVLRGNLTRYEEAAIRAIVAALRQQPAPVDLEQFRKAVECWHDAALPANSVDAERKAEAKRLLSIIDNAILPSATNTIIGSVSPEMRPLAGGAVVKRANKAAAIATFVFFLTLAASYMCGVPIIERSPDNGLSYFLAVLFAVAAFAISATP